MPTLTFPEFILLVGGIWAAWKWYVTRRDARSALSTDKAEADKTVKTLTEALAHKNTELNEVQEDRNYWMRRAMHAESMLTSRGFGA